MGLRYKGVPDRGRNEIADKLLDVCLCRFIGVGVPLDGRDCKIHGTFKHGCDECWCQDYRPNKIKESPGHWPRCECGHIAQEHNQKMV